LKGQIVVNYVFSVFSKICPYLFLKDFMMKKIFSLLLTTVLSLTMTTVLFAKSPEGNGKEWKVIVSVDDQVTYVYKNNELVRKMICSTGIVDGDKDTPLGDYILNESGEKRGAFFFSKRFGEGGKWWVGFIGGVYLFHSVPVDANGNIIKEEEKLLGKQASHGCVRLSMDDAYWFYSTVPDGAKVHIQMESNL
jgi:lipoprotein-anchoring transpeptidase ErfK/SrfK